MSIKKIYNIYEKYNKNFINISNEIYNSFRVNESSLIEDEYEKYTFNKILYDIGLSKYANFNWSIVDYDLMPQSFEYYEDYDILENDISACDFSKEANTQTATEVFEKIMIYGGEKNYKKLVHKIIEEIKKENKKIGEKMENYFNNNY